MYLTSARIPLPDITDYIRYLDPKGKRTSYPDRIQRDPPGGSAIWEAGTEIA